MKYPGAWLFQVVKHLPPGSVFPHASGAPHVPDSRREPRVAPRPPPAGLARRRRLRPARGTGERRARPGPDPGAQPPHVRRPLHARPDERREVLRPAVPAGRADGRRRGRRGRRLRRRGHRGRRPRAARPRLARVRRAGRQARHQGRRLPRPALRLPGRARHAGPDRLRRSLRGRLLQGGRRRVRLRRRGSGRQPRRPVREDQGRVPGDRLGQARTKR